MEKSPDKKEEMLCCFNIENIKYFHTGKISPYIFPKIRSEVHNKRIPHLVVRLFAQSHNGKFLIQKRSLKKKSNKGKWADSASGHVVYNEDITYEDIEENIKRELFEEMGVKLSSIRFYKMFLDKDEKLDIEFNYVFVGYVEEGLHLNLNEVDEKSDFFEKSDLINMLSNELWVKSSKSIWLEIIDGKTNSLFNNMQEQAKIAEKPLNSDHSERIGLIIGRFQPFHNGHLYLVKESFKYVSKLKIVVGSSQFSDLSKNPFSYQERELFISDSLKNEGISLSKFEIFAIPDQFDMGKWMNKISSIVGHFDIIFTNSLWIGRLFQQKNKDMIYGLKYDLKKYNGTKIRNFIFNNQPEWAELVPNTVFKYINQPFIIKRMKMINKDD